MTSGRLLLADPDDVRDLLPQFESASSGGGSANLREIAQVVPTGGKGVYEVGVRYEDGIISAVLVDFGPSRREAVDSDA